MRKPIEEADGLRPTAYSPEQPDASPADRRPQDDLVRISLLVACASVLQVAESMLPYPVPGVRIGLANIVTLIALARLGPAEAVRVSLLRTVIGSVVMGTFLSPAFILSFAGALASALVMVALYALSRSTPVRFSLLGLSLAGSVCHIGAQVAVVYALFIRSGAVVGIWPWLALVAVGTGLLTGLMAVRVCRRLERADAGDTRYQIPDTRYQIAEKGTGRDTGAIDFLHRAPAGLKLTATVAFAVLIIAVHSFVAYGAALAAIAALALLSRIPARRLAGDLRRLALFLALALVTPVLFTGWGRVVFALGPLRVTGQGLTAGALFAGRILLLFFATSILAWTTPAQEVARVLGAVLAPVRALGMSPEKMAAIASLSWSFFPALWDRAQRLVSGRRGARGLGRVIEELVADVYREAERRRI
jgi:heptaprenyl diphosphate synthase